MRFIIWIASFLMAVIIDVLKFSKYLFVLFLGLKLADFIDWNWMLICIPLICYLVFVLFYTLFIMLTNEDIKLSLREYIGLKDNK